MVSQDADAHATHQPRYICADQIKVEPRSLDAKLCVQEEVLCCEHIPTGTVAALKTRLSAASLRGPWWVVGQQLPADRIDDRLEQAFAWSRSRTCNKD